MLVKNLSTLDKGDEGHEEGLTAGDITEARGPHMAVAQRGGFKIRAKTIMKSAMEQEMLDSFFVNTT
jgi:hypothetical protein